MLQRHDLKKLGEFHSSKMIYFAFVLTFSKVFLKYISHTTSCVTFCWDWPLLKAPVYNTILKDQLYRVVIPVYFQLWRRWWLWLFTSDSSGHKLHPNANGIRHTHTHTHSPKTVVSTHVNGIERLYLQFW